MAQQDVRLVVVVVGRATLYRGSGDQTWHCVEKNLNQSHFFLVQILTGSVSWSAVDLSIRGDCKFRQKQEVKLCCGRDFHDISRKFQEQVTAELFLTSPSILGRPSEHELYAFGLFCIDCTLPSLNSPPSTKSTPHTPLCFKERARPHSSA